MTNFEFHKDDILRIVKEHHSFPVITKRVAQKFLVGIALLITL